MLSSAFFMKNYLIILFILFSLVACQTQKAFELESQIIEEFKGSSIRAISLNSEGVIWLSGSKGLVASSEDNGETWKKFNIPDPDSLDFRSIITPSKSEIIIASAGYPARIYRSQDEGMSWNLVYENLDSSAFINSLLYNKTYDLYFAFGDVLNGIHLLLKSENNGKSWSRLNSIPKAEKGENGFAASNACMAFHHNKIVVALGGKSARMLMSQNLGEDWNFYPTPRKNTTAFEGVYAMATNKKKLVAVGGDFSQANEKSQVIWSTDGLNWQLSTQKTNGYRSTVVYNSYYNCWLAAGSNGIDISESAEVWKQISDLNLNILRNSFDGKWLIGANNKGQVFKVTLK